MPPLRQPIEEMTYNAEPRVSDERFHRVRQMVEAAIEREWARREVARGQNRFRMVYGLDPTHQMACVLLGCPHACDPHFHRRVRRIGHLPMFTIKELPA